MDKKETWRERLELKIYKKYNVTIGADFVVFVICFLMLIIVMLSFGIYSFLNTKEIEIDSNFQGFYISENEDFVKYYNDSEYNNSIIASTTIDNINEKMIEHIDTSEILNNTLYLFNDNYNYSIPMKDNTFENVTTHLHLFSYDEFIKDKSKNSNFYIFINTDKIVENNEYINYVYGNISNNGFNQSKTILYNNNDNINTMFPDLTVENPPILLLSFENDEIKTIVDDLSYMPFADNDIPCKDKEKSITESSILIEDFLSEWITLAVPMDESEEVQALCNEKNYTPAEWKSMQEANEDE